MTMSTEVILNNLVQSAVSEQVRSLVVVASIAAVALIIASCAAAWLILGRLDRICNRHKEIDELLMVCQQRAKASRGFWDGAYDKNSPKYSREGSVNSYRDDDEMRDGFSDNESQFSMESYASEQFYMMAEGMNQSSQYQDPSNFGGSFQFQRARTSEAEHRRMRTLTKMDYILEETTTHRGGAPRQQPSSPTRAPSSPTRQPTSPIRRPESPVRRQSSPVGRRTNSSGSRFYAKVVMRDAP
mmetsp:Transcript_19440/g.44505  ORF Transcript_19440/g.44505 Transcript_19440/m.44505 type:complete len:242 (-) Transcript_19440:235-960(-)